MFIFNDISSTDMDIICETLPPINIPIKDTQEINIDGRNGVYIIEKDYKPINKQVIVHYVGFDYDLLSLWLQGSGKVIFSNVEDRFYKCIIDNSIPINEIIEKKLSRFVINFKCQPFGYSLKNDTIIISNSNFNFYNYGTVYSTPLIKVNGSGNISLTIQNSNGTKTINLIDVNEYVVIDSDLMICVKGNENLSNRMKGEYPLLYPQNNNITFTGNVRSIEVTPNIRFLI